MTSEKKVANDLDSYVINMTKRIWFNINKEINERGFTCRGICREAGLDHSHILFQLRSAKNGGLPMNSKLEVFDKLSKALGHSISYFMR